jgi:hypothetical protein
MLIFLFLVVVAKAAKATKATKIAVAVVGLLVIMFFYLLKHYLLTLTRLLLVLVARSRKGVRGLLAVQVFLIRLLRLVVEEDMGAEIMTAVDAVEATRFMGVVNRRTLIMSLGPRRVVVEQDLPLMVQMPQATSAALADLVIIYGV